MKKVARFLAIALLLGTGFLGISNGFGELGEGTTALQQSVTFAVLLYGVFGFLGAIGLIRRRPWSVTVAAAWAVAVAWAASIASFAFHDPTFSQQGTLAGVAGAFVSIALIGAFVVWTARSATRVPLPSDSAHIPPP